LSESQAPYHELLERCRREPPRVALVLGSGLGEIAEQLDCEVTVPFGAVPEMAAPSVAGHKGELRLGTWAGRRLLVFVGRLHYYEGHPWRRVEQQVPMARELGAQIVLVTNAAGGIRDDLCPGSLMPIHGHLDWTGDLSWRPRGMGERPTPYSSRLLDVLRQAADTLGLNLKPGVYAQVTGPCYETPAEIRALRSCGVDAVGMSTCREINRAQALGIECAALSFITNRAAGLGDGTIHHDDVMAAGQAWRERLGQLLDAFLRVI
jgi:purine-nucleoside phosphorylase